MFPRLVLEVTLRFDEFLKRIQSTIPSLLHSNFQSLHCIAIKVWTPIRFFVDLGWAVDFGGKIQNSKPVRVSWQVCIPEGQVIVSFSFGRIQSIHLWQLASPRNAICFLFWETKIGIFRYFWLECRSNPDLEVIQDYKYIDTLWFLYPKYIQNFLGNFYTFFPSCLKYKII